MNISTKIVTPEMATEWLKGNFINRPLNVRHVDTLASEMSKGRWKSNGDTICFNGDTLIDGQHRLEACVKSGVAFETIVVSGLPSDVFDTKDAGKIRSAADVLSIRGEKNAAKIAASLKIVDRYLTGRMASPPRYTNTDVEALLVQHPGIRESVSHIKTTKKLLSYSILTGLHYLFAQKDKALADEVADKLISGVGLQVGEPVYLLRERLMRNMISKEKLSPRYIAALLIKAWNATRDNTTIRTLRFREEGDSPEQFPVIC